VHKETIDKIPAALPGRYSLEIEVYGMEGIPADAMPGRANEGEPSAKFARPSMPSMMQPMGFPPMMPMMPGYPMPGYGGYPGMMQSMMPRIPMPAMPSAGNVFAQFTATRPQLYMSPPTATPAESTTTATSAAAVATFPAYSSASIAEPTDAATTSESNAPKIASGASTKIVHPDEDISLEERRALMPKYRQILGPPTGSYRQMLGQPTR